MQHECLLFLDYSTVGNILLEKDFLKKLILLFVREFKVQRNTVVHGVPCNVHMRIMIKIEKGEKSSRKFQKKYHLEEPVIYI